MKFITYAENLTQLQELSILVETKKIDLSDLEVIVGNVFLSRYSENTVAGLDEMIAFNQKAKLPLILEWDVLQQETLFQKNVEMVSRLPLHEFKAVRVQDPGALNFIKEKFPWLKIQLILENGNHNYVGLSRWSSFLGEQLDRLVLSNELSREHLGKYATELNADLEVLVFGRILLFYSPRLLLTPVNKDAVQKEFEKNIERYAVERAGACGGCDWQDYQTPDRFPGPSDQRREIGLE